MKPKLTEEEIAAAYEAMANDPEFIAEEAERRKNRHLRRARHQEYLQRTNRIEADYTYTK